MPNNSEYLWGLNMNNWKTDGLTAAWGARGIINYTAGGLYVDRDNPFQLLGDRQSVVGDPTLARCLVDIWNAGLKKAVMRFVADNHRKDEVVHRLWSDLDITHESEWTRTDPLEVTLRMAGGYVYIRVGLRAPVEKGVFTSYDEYVAANKTPSNNCVYVSKTRSEVGSQGLIDGKWEGTLVTYCHEGPWQYGFVCSIPWFTERYPSDAKLFTESHPYGRPWAWFRNVTPFEWEEGK